VIRRARPGDADALAQVHLRSALRAYAGIFPPEAPEPTLPDVTDLWALTIAEADTFAAEIGGRCVGGVAIYTTEDGPGWGHLRRLYVDPEHWGEGLGSQLHDVALGAARERGLDAITLWVLEENHRARAMYAARGWEQVDGARFTHVGLAVAEVQYRLGILAGT
jgi:GNAT superfamily N-acetyltransferase